MKSFNLKQRKLYDTFLLILRSSTFLTTEVVTLTCNILMFPFSIETSEIFLERTLE